MEVSWSDATTKLVPLRRQAARTWMKLSSSTTLVTIHPAHHLDISWETYHDVTWITSASDDMPTINTSTMRIHLGNAAGVSASPNVSSHGFVQMAGPARS